MRPSYETPFSALVLERGRLTARPGPDLYVYAFLTASPCRTEIGRRGEFVCGFGTFRARLIDHRGPVLSLSLKADKPLGPGVSGVFQPNPPEPVSDSAPLADEAAMPPGAAAFLDPHEGWIMSAAEAAGRKAASFSLGFWPVVCRDELSGRLSPSGITFIWSQNPDEDASTAVVLAAYFSGKYERTLVVADAPAELEPLAGLAGAVFSGEASPGTPLHPVSIYTRAAEAREARDVEQAGLRNDLALLKSAEAGVKARLGQWTDLDELEARFENLGREAALYCRQWEEARREVERAGAFWEEARAVVDQSGRGLWGWVRRGGPAAKAVRREEEARQNLEKAEAAMSTVRREEGRALDEARRLEARLRPMRLESESWTGRDELAAELNEMRGRQDQVAARLAASMGRPAAAPEGFLTGARLTLALAGDVNPGEILADQRFSAILALAGPPADHNGRRRLASLVLKAEEHLTVVGDFTFWPVWSGRAPDLNDRPGIPAWTGLVVAEETDELKQYLAEGGLFDHQSLPPGGPVLARLELGSGSDATAFEFAEPAENMNQGFGLRAVGEIGPANPVSALAVARAAFNFAASLDEDGPAAIVLTASAAQGRLINLMWRDLQAPAGRLFCGEPPDFIHWPKAPLVIVDPAFEAPHVSHPWAWPSFGRQRLMWAWRLARDHIWLSGRDGWIRRLPEESPLRVIWSMAAPSSPGLDLSDPAEEPALAFWEALDKAREEVWAVMPAFEPFWWKPLEEHFLAASRRRVKVTILAAPPAVDADKEYVGGVLRTLSAYGCHVHLADGFPGFMAVVDEAHFTWGRFLDGACGAQVWSGLKSALMPEAGPEITKIMQLRLINEKMGRRGGGLGNCRQCGWPLLLVNQDRPRGFGDEQPLKLSCMGCRGPKALRRLDERAPFDFPPKCGENSDVSYRRVWRNRQEFWVCPDHPDGRDCPSLRVLPGDAT